VPDLRDQQCVVAAPQPGQAGQVRPGGEDERLAGDADRDDVLAVERGVDGLVERCQRLRPESVGAIVVQAVVEGDQAEDAGAGEPDLAQVRLRDALGVGGDLLGTGQKVGHHAAPFQFGFSQMTVPPMPMPMHMVVMP
jgi:hypothetical protein